MTEIANPRIRFCIWNKTRTEKMTGREKTKSKPVSMKVE